MRIGIDLGGTKIELAALAADGALLLRERTATPRNDYNATIRTVRELVEAAETRLRDRGSVGLAIPGAIARRTGLVKNANSTWLNGHPIDRDLAAALQRPVRVANDANCFALSESADGAGAGAEIVFGIIAGTGVGGGIAIAGRVLEGANGIAGEWGHNTLPAPCDDERPGPSCYCGRTGCIERWLSGPALAEQFLKKTGRQAIATEIAQLAEDGDPAARALMEEFYDRFARAIAGVVNILDPDVIVLGGGVSNMTTLYRELPARVLRYAFTADSPTRVVKNVHGDSSGVRGAAWLWPEPAHSRTT